MPPPTIPLRTVAVYSAAAALASLLLFGMAAVAPAPAEPEAREAAVQPARPEPVKDAAALWLVVGGSGPAERYWVGWDSVLGPGKPGWPAFIERVAVPAVQELRNAGHAPHIFISNPFGFDRVRGGAAMEFDAALEAPAWLREGFEEAWGAWMAENPDVRVTCYLGTLHHRETFAGLNSARWLERFEQSIRPALAAGMEVGFDASGNVPEGTPAAAAMALVEALGHTVYVEARPTQRYLAGKPVICIYTTYARTNPERFPDARQIGYLRNDQLGPTTILIPQTGTPDARAQAVREHVAAGRKVAFAVPRDEYRKLLALAAEVARAKPADAEAEER